MSTVTRVAIRPDASPPDALVAALFAAGVEALQEIDGVLVTQAPTPEAAAAWSAAAIATDPRATVECTPAADTDWSVAWRQQIRAHTVGLLTVTPPWMADAFLPERRIVIEPAMAFGTGDHATTRGVLLLMQDVIRRGDFVADLGAGSAVLSIAAARLGASRVVAIELDADSVRNAEENVAANGVGDVVTCLEGDAAVFLPLVAPVRVVLANIISSVIRDLLPAIRAALASGGVAIFSGMLVTERDQMRAAFAAAGGVVRAEQAEGEWWSCTVGWP